MSEQSNKKEELASLKKEFPISSVEKHNRIKKAVELASARYQLSLGENRLWNYALENAKKNSSGIYVSSFSIEDFLTAVGMNHHGNNSIKKFKAIGRLFINKKIYAEEYVNGELNRFTMINIVSKFVCDKDTRQIDIEFTPPVTDILDRTKKLVSLDSTVLYGLPSNIGVILYEKLIIAIDNADNMIPQSMPDEIKVYTLHYTVNELKVILGMVDIYDENLPESSKNIIGQELSELAPNYDLIVSLCKNTYFSKWYEIKRALDRAIKLINEKSDIVLSYESQKGDTGKSIQHITFFTAKKVEKKLSKNISHEKDKSLKSTISEEKYTLVMSAHEMYKEYFSEYEIFLVLKEADFDFDKVRTIVEKALNNKYVSDKNIMGWVLNSIRYDEGEHFNSFKSNEKKKKRESLRDLPFLNYMEHEIDYDAEEKEFLELQDKLDFPDKNETENKKDYEKSIQPDDKPTEELLDLLKSLPNDQVASIIKQLEKNK